MGRSKRSAQAGKQFVGKSKKELSRIARRKGIAGLHAMRKDEIVDALAALAEPARRPAAGSGPPSVLRSSRRTGRTAPATSGKRFSDPAAPPRASARKQLGAEAEHDRLVLLVRDSYWLHVYWEISRATLDRTAAALGSDWYLATPVLRLLDLTAEETTSAAETVVREIPIHGGNHWYLDVDRPARAYRVDLGYRTAKGRFFAIARSNIVAPPKPSQCDPVDEHWQSLHTDCDRVFALSGGLEPGGHSLELRHLFEERLHRPMRTGSLNYFGCGALAQDQHPHLPFELDAELIIYGRTLPSARVTLDGEPVRVRPDGTFTVRYGLPEGRQVVPAVAQTANGIQERTVILAVERNTKELDVIVHDGQE